MFELNKYSGIDLINNISKSNHNPPCSYNLAIRIKSALNIHEIDSEIEYSFSKSIFLISTFLKSLNDIVLLNLFLCSPELH